jgi:hypothetical protein
MAEKLPELSKDSVLAGSNCLALLDAHGLGVQGAAWVLSETLYEWRFYIVTALVDIDGPSATFERIERLFALTKWKELLIDDVHLGSPDEPLFVNLAKFFRKTGEGVAQLKDVQINNFRIADAFIYRLDLAPIRTKLQEKRRKFDAHLEELKSHMA